MRIFTVPALSLLTLMAPLSAAEQKKGAPAWSSRVQTVLDVTKPLEFERGRRLPLYLWPAMNPGDLDQATAEHLVRELDRPGQLLVTGQT